MDQERVRIQEDLRGVIDGEVRCDDLFLQLYSSDASIYQVQPIGVIRPRHVHDVVASVQYASEHGISIHARGSGSGLAGESLGSGLVIDFSHYMRRILGFDGESVRFQPGVVHARLNRYLHGHNRIFGPDPSTGQVTTMGSVLALDNSGSHWLKYGSARSHVEELEVVLSDGTVLRLGRDSNLETLCAVPSRRNRRTLEDQPPVARLDDIQQRLRGLLTTHRDTIRQFTPQSLVHRCGYHLNNLQQGDHLDLAKLVTGSEGTLALITEAKVRTDPLPAHTGVLLLFFDRIEKAIQASVQCVKMDVTACDLLDRRLLVLARDTDPRFIRSIPSDAEAMLLVEVIGDSRTEVRDRLAHIAEQIHRATQLAFASRIALEKEEIQQAWSLTQNVIPTLYRLKGNTRAIPLVEDIAIPPGQIPTVLPLLQEVLRKHQVTASMFGHIGHGQLHIRPFLDVNDQDDVRKLHALATELYEPVVSAGGSISGEHGVGLSRTWFMRRQFGPLYEVFSEVKRLFDPLHIFNPGKVIAEMPQPIHNNLRPLGHKPEGSPGSPVHARSAAPEITGNSLQLAWTHEELAYATRNCNGCARCRTEDEDTRMCPIFRFAPREEASPRAKANLIRGVITGRLPLTAMQDNEFKQITDLCVNCHQCRIECPAGVDIPRMVTEAKAQYVATNGMRFSESLFTRLDRTARWASRFSRFYNFAIGNRQLRWIMQKFTGLAQGRKLPEIARTSFLKSAVRQRLDRPSREEGEKVVYFSDVYATWFDPALANAVVRIMQHNGIPVYVPHNQLWSAASAIAEGDIPYARRIAQKNVKLLADAIRQGYTVITSEPSASMCLTQEYPALLDDDDANLVAENTQDVCHYLWNLHRRGKLELTFKPLNYHVGYHLPCHLRALNQHTPGEHLLRLIPGMQVQRIEKGCSGMAGVFGLKHVNYRNSLRSGWGLLSTMRDSEIQVGTTECSACKIQMEQGTTKPTLHPMKLMALAYNLMPEIQQQLTNPKRDLIVS
ncbi:MAG: anaerobic glycerol-3-phosphate dehydrogenase subunit C [Planctomycetota bacterium]|nr:anaerobic glycerol-3-phosphate dehydrogenase subunit C [Planctomycetota bacterium]